MPWNLQQTVIAQNGVLVPSNVSSDPSRIFGLIFNNPTGDVAPICDVQWRNTLQSIGSSPIFRAERTIYLSGETWVNEAITSTVWELYLYFRERSPINGEPVEIWKFS